MMTRTFPAPGAIFRHAALLVTAALILGPFVWMVSLSIKPPGEIFRASFSFWPEQFYGIENYTKAITQAPLLRYMFNGVIVCASILALQIAVCAPAAYALAKLEFAGRNLLFALVLIALLLPHEVLAVPLFILGAKIGVLNTYAVLIFPYGVSPFGIFLFRQFFKTIPDDVVHAARLDGYSELGIVWKIMVPMGLPAIIAFGIFSVVSHWNSLFWPLIAVRDQNLMPPPLGIMAFKNEEAGNDYGPLMAASTLVVAPLAIAFLAAQRWFVEGLARGAVK
ncbi:carbohydrate ABC transporter permease [Sinorhizobium medicae]|uniref:carbohydrate ABC transporter permease n=1 Tax=Sinorhizobium medicae TaxID=110321 RepID=UPI00129521E0|nr:carbohydrate ABC transporter permease [Sinorhizobium medicae]MDX0967277.1 ABC transporter permease subunit [Sinorhizobium medicae]MQV47031.1 ABC transporter permease subunit [Sinorhizobium medicae]MQV53083.1 ABC transporter permease subunit [Sinorhizobium medicae]MQV75127.1 ABC transporter permease subunit [Sinorhizobium medicae]